jgi:hypothetical protein
MSVMYLLNFTDPAYINKIILEVKNSEMLPMKHTATE